MLALAQKQSARFASYNTFPLGDYCSTDSLEIFILSQAILGDHMLALALKQSAPFACNLGKERYFEIGVFCDDILPLSGKKPPFYDHEILYYDRDPAYTYKHRINPAYTYKHRTNSWSFIRIKRIRFLRRRITYSSNCHASCYNLIFVGLLWGY